MDYVGKTPRVRFAAAILALALSAAAPVGAATLTVETLDDIDDADGFCSLREAITAANSDSPVQECPAGDGHDVIDFGVEGTIALTSALPVLNRSADLVGPGANALILDGSDAYPVLVIGSHAAFPSQEYSISGLTLRRGAATNGAALRVAGGHKVTLREVALLDNHASGFGGAIYLSSAAGLASPTVATLERCWLHGNTAASTGGAIWLYSGVELTIRSSTLSDNHTGDESHANANGGAIRITTVGDPAPVVAIYSSTISGNSATGQGGGIHVGDTNLTILDSTITDNTADSDGDGSGFGGGIVLLRASVTLGNSIVAANSSLPPASPSPDIGVSGEGYDLVSLGHNLIGSNQGATVVLTSGDPNPDGDAVGSAGDEIDPLLAPRADNGGFIPTHLPDAASPAVDQGSCPGVHRDQRGHGNPASYWRPVDDPAVADAGDGCDKGSVERGAGSIPAEEIFLNGFEDGDTRYWLES